jgi:hypothetical protein
MEHITSRLHHNINNIIRKQGTKLLSLSYLLVTTDFQ